MALVNVTNVVVLDNPTAFTNPLTFEVTFECLQELDADLEWKVIYVGSAEDERFDQVLEEVDVGPIPVGVNKFVLTAESPDPATIPSTDLVGVTVTLITCCYKGKEFIRVGYYVNNEHNDPAVNAEIQEGRIPPADMLDPACITRNILADKPRVTRFPIDWNAAPGEAGTASTEGASTEVAMMDEEEEEEQADDMVGDEADEDMGVPDGNAGDEMGSESMGSDGEDDRSVDLEDEGSGDGIADGEADMDPDADSSGAEEMEDLGGDATRSAAPRASGTEEDGEGVQGGEAGVLPDTGEEGDVEAVVAAKGTASMGAGQTKCGAEGKSLANANANANGGALLC